jgi:hypothetical protein
MSAIDKERSMKRIMMGRRQAWVEIENRIDIPAEPH